MAETMKAEYDFSLGKRGQFAAPGAQLAPPLHLEPAVFDYFSAIAIARGTSLNALVNDLLRKDIELIEVAK